MINVTNDGNILCKFRLVLRGRCQPLAKRHVSWFKEEPSAFLFFHVYPLHVSRSSQNVTQSSFPLCEADAQSCKDAWLCITFMFVWKQGLVIRSSYLVALLASVMGKVWGVGNGRKTWLYYVGRRPFTREVECWTLLGWVSPHWTVSIKAAASWYSFLPCTPRLAQGLTQSSLTINACWRNHGGKTQPVHLKLLIATLMCLEATFFMKL